MSSMGSPFYAQGFNYDPRKHKVTMLKPGKQGVVGVVDDTRSKTTSVFKMSSIFGFIATHENAVMEALKDIHKFCPFFIKGYGLRNITVDVNLEETDNPFEVEDLPVKMDVVFAEYVQNSKKLVQLNRHQTISDDVLASQVLLALTGSMLANRLCGFTHYDLHSENLLVQKCDPNDVFLYHDPGLNTSYLIPTHGYYPRIIDYGFSHVDSLTHVTSPLGFMCNGYTSHRADPYADFRVLLVSFLDDCKRYRPENGITAALDRVLKELYEGQEIDWESGWILNGRKSSSEYLHHEFKHLTRESPTFAENDLCIYDMMQSLIAIHPIEDTYPDASTEELIKEMETGIDVFLREFMAIERDFDGDTQLGLYIMRCVVAAAAGVRSTYYSSVSSTQREAARHFQNALFEYLKPLKSYYHPRVNPVKMLTALFVCVEVMQAIVAREVRYRNKFIDRQNQHIGLRPDEIFHVVHHHMTPRNFVASEDTRIVYMDETYKCMRVLRLTQGQADQVNAILDDEQYATRNSAATAQAALVRAFVNESVTQGGALITNGYHAGMRKVVDDDSSWSDSARGESEDSSSDYDWSSKSSAGTPRRRSLGKFLSATTGRHTIA